MKPIKTTTYLLPYYVVSFIVWLFVWGAVANRDHSLQADALTASDLIVPGNYLGDARPEIAFYRPSVSTWYFQAPGNPSQALALVWGAPTDVPVALDFDGDGRVDPTVYRPSTGVWWILKSNCEYTCYETRALIVP